MALVGVTHFIYKSTNDRFTNLRGNWKNLLENGVVVAAAAENKREYEKDLSAKLGIVDIHIREKKSQWNEGWGGGGR